MHNPIWDVTFSPSAKRPLSFWLGLTHPAPLTALPPLLQKDAAELGVRPVSSLVDHGRNSDLSDIQEEEEEEEEEEELGSRTCSFQKQVAGKSIRENGIKVMGCGGLVGPRPRVPGASAPCVSSCSSRH